MMFNQKLSRSAGALTATAVVVLLIAPASAETELFLNHCDPNLPRDEVHAHQPCSIVNCEACNEVFGGGDRGLAAEYVCDLIKESWPSTAEYVAEELLHLKPGTYVPSILLIEWLINAAEILNAFAEVLPTYACGSGSQLTINTALACLDGFTDDCLDHLYTGIGLCPWIQVPGSGPLDVQTMINKCNQGGNALIGCMGDRLAHAEVYDPIGEMHQCRTNPNVGPCGSSGLVHCQSGQPTCAPRTDVPPGVTGGPRYCTTIACGGTEDCPSGNTCIASVCVQN